MLAPVRTPGVTTDPIVDAVLGTPAVQLNSVIDHDGIAVVIHSNTTRVRFQTVGIDVGRHGATSIDFRHDILFAINSTELADSNFRIVGDSIYMKLTQFNSNCYISRRGRNLQQGLFGSQFMQVFMSVHCIEDYQSISN